MNKSYVYIYLDPRKKGIYIYQGLQDFKVMHAFYFQPFYIGKGTGNRIKRGLEIKYIKNNPFKLNTIKKIKSENLVPITIKLKDRLTSEEACVLEIAVIKEIGRADIVKGYLTNLTDGGEGVKGPVISENKRIILSNKMKELYLNGTSNIEKMRTANKGNKYRLGKLHSKETRDLIGSKGIGRKDSIPTKEKKSKSFKGRVYSEEHNNKISKALKGKTFTKEHRKNLSLSHIGQLVHNAKKLRNVETNEIFNSSTEASKVYKVDRHRIIHCCQGKIKTCGGYHWEFIKIM